MGIVGELGQFIPGQVIRRLRVPAGMENALLGYFQGRGVTPGWEDEDVDDVKENGDGNAAEELRQRRQFGINRRFEDAEAIRLERVWPREPSRHAFLADTSNRRIVVSISAGVGKSTVVQQLAYVTRKLNPEQLVAQIEMRQVPTESIGGKREFIHKGTDSILFQQLLDDIEEARNHVTQVCGRHSNLPEVDPSRNESAKLDSRLLPWLRTCLQRGEVTLIIDGIDQVDLATVGDRARAIREFLNLFPRVRCVLAGRPYSIVKIWGREASMSNLFGFTS